MVHSRKYIARSILYAVFCINYIVYSVWYIVYSIYRSIHHSMPQTNWLAYLRMV